MARTTKINITNIPFIQLDEKYKTTENGGNILVEVWHEWRDVIDGTYYIGIFRELIRNLIFLSFEMPSNESFKKMLIEKDLENFDKNEVGSYAELTKKRAEISRGLKYEDSYEKYINEVMVARRETAKLFLENLKIDEPYNTCGIVQFSHKQVDEHYINAICSICNTVKIIDPEKLYDHQNFQEGGQYLYANLYDYFVTRIQGIF